MDNEETFETITIEDDNDRLPDFDSLMPTLLEQIEDMNVEDLIF